jgi:hypothetical protein
MKLEIGSDVLIKLPSVFGLRWVVVSEILDNNEYVGMDDDGEEYDFSLSQVQKVA